METKNLVSEIRKLLPGGDCTGRGGCGYATCDLCAKAIAGGAEINRCPACDQTALDAIAALTGRDPVEAKPLTAFVRCSGSAAGKARLKVYSSCDEAVKSGFTADECKYGCVGAGSVGFGSVGFGSVAVGGAAGSVGFGSSLGFDCAGFVGVVPAAGSDCGLLSAGCVSSLCAVDSGSWTGSVIKAVSISATVASV